MEGKGKKLMILRFLGEMTGLSLTKTINTGGSKFEINVVWVTMNFDDVASHLPLLFLHTTYYHMTYYIFTCLLIYCLSPHLPQPTNLSSTEEGT